MRKWYIYSNFQNLFKFFIENCAIKRDNIVSSIDFAFRKCFLSDLPKRFNEFKFAECIFYREEAEKNVYVCACVFVIMCEV